MQFLLLGELQLQWTCAFISQQSRKSRFSTESELSGREAVDKAVAVESWHHPR